MSKTIALYLRLSLADGDLGKDNKNESNSIENQRMLLHTYIESHKDLEGEIVEYTDDGYTGTNFDRPGFKKMVEDAKAGKIQVLMVKDLSRLGRDYIGVGDYIEQIFPVLGIRFIAVGNNYDSAAYSDGTMGMDIAISNLINQMYSKDLSKKLRSSMEVRWKQGQATSPNVIYGYLWDKSDPKRWVIDPVASGYVRRLFDLALEGKGTTQIAEQLNREKIPTPGLYSKMKKRAGYYQIVAPEKELLWNQLMVRRLLNKYEYTGALVMGKRQTIFVGKKIYRNMPKEDWVITENAHDAIVTHEEFEQAQEAIRYRKETVRKGGSDDPLKGKVRCGNCRRVMITRTQDEKDCYMCKYKDNVGKYAGCFDGKFKMSILHRLVEDAIRKTVAAAKRAENELSEEENSEDAAKAQAETKKLQGEVDILKAERIRQYESYADGVITREGYIRKRAELTERIETLEAKIREKEGRREETGRILDGVRSVTKHAGEIELAEGLTRNLADAFVDAVYIYDDKHVEIVLSCEDVIREAVKRCEN